MNAVKNVAPKDRIELRIVALDMALRSASFDQPASDLIAIAKEIEKYLIDES